jgi:hypothetical protein
MTPHQSLALSSIWPAWPEPANWSNPGDGFVVTVTFYRRLSLISTWRKAREETIPSSSPLFMRAAIGEGDWEETIEERTSLMNKVI